MGGIHPGCTLEAATLRTHPAGGRQALRVRLIRTVRSEAGKVFKGDPKSLDAQSDPTGWRALLGGDYSGRTASLLGIQEDHPLVDVILSMRKAIADGDYDGRLAKYGIQEDHPLSDFLLGLNKQLFPAMADGGE